MPLRRMKLLNVAHVTDNSDEIRQRVFARKLGRTANTIVISNMITAVRLR